MEYNMTWLEINVSQIRKNFLAMKATYPANQKVGVMLKGNAYGHGLIEVTECLYDLADIIYVIEPSDAINIRNWEKEKGYANIRILVVGTVDQYIAKELALVNVEFALIDKSFQKWSYNIFADVPTARIHVFVDTGLGREGILWNDLGCVENLKDIDNVQIVGVMTHFSNAERKGPPEYAQKQLHRFQLVVDKIRNDITNNIDIEVHAAASAPSILYVESLYDATRLGISLFGYWTSIESTLGSEYIHRSNSPDLKPILTWKAMSKNIKLIPKGDYIGYDCAYLCENDTKVAVFQVGYFDGYPSLYNIIAWVLIDGIRCSIIGNVMMNCIVVDIGKINLGSREILEAILIGKSGTDYIDADRIATWATSSNYHVLTSIGQHLPRKLIYKETE